MRLELPMEALFQACLAVLQEARMPLHYHELTLRAFRKLHASFGQEAFALAFAKNRENVREKFLQRSWHGHAFYVGDPYCLGGLRTWFASPQLLLLQTDVIHIPGHATAGSEGAYEALMRHPFMQTKNPFASLAARVEGLARGQVLEKHVQRWFQEQYPQLYRPARNATQWHRWDKDDFYLQIGARMLGIDILGARRDGTYTLAEGKQRTDIHLLCRIADASCLFEGVQRGTTIRAQVLPPACGSPVNFLVWLNCVQGGLDYYTLQAHAQ
jgi:hypothetical protein